MMVIGIGPRRWDTQRMQTSSRARVSIGVAIGTVIGLVAVPAYAEAPSDANNVEDTVQALAAIPEAGPIADASEFDVEPNGDLTHTTADAALTIESGAGLIIELDSTFHDPLRVDAGPVQTVEIADEGTAVFASADYAVTPLPQDDGSVQIVNVLESSAAPERFDYHLSSTSALTLEIQDTGSVLVLNAAGEFVGGVAPPWAFDATGAVVPTHFEVAGSTLSQVIDHQGRAYTYPISADPYLGHNLWGSITEGSANGQPTVNLNLTSWGKTYQPSPWILIDYGWPEATNRSLRFRDLLMTKASMRQQYDCHAFGSYFAGEWNLERFRPNRTVDWTAGVAVHHCNWTTATLY
ncbi:hypothetical protein IF188_16300 [Microbacterium sp. NEAU-LLC]|uniref:DUF2599 domain-containing protein n=1 Tax=Microbacterium helvum TaxID=2773713 RepID=A0ABR8NRK4_9MICO|nr:hypothetical protein [Microbacterium helvum]MBD3943255.1 hypothetical protein [Microbacterium helvum]